MIIRNTTKTMKDIIFKKIEAIIIESEKTNENKVS